MNFSRFSATLLVSLALGLAACDSPDSDDTSGGSTGAETEPTTGVSAETGSPDPGSTTASATTGDPTTGDPDTGDTEDPSDTEGPGDTEGADETGTPDDSTGTAGDESGGEDPCDSGFTCSSAVPEGWNGPVAIVETDGAQGPATCEGSYAEFSFSANANLDAPPAACDCSCSDAVDAECPDEVVLAHTDDDGVCMDDGDTTQTVGTACQPQVLAGGGYWRVLQPDVEGGSCSPSSQTTLPPTSWGTTVTGCALAEAPSGEGCDAGELCVPEPEMPAEANVCIWADGDQACPAGFDDRSVFYDDFVDSRGCSECSCGDPVGTCSEPEVRLHPNGSCACQSGNACNVGTTCEELSFDSVLSADLRVPPELEGVASCAPADVGPTGDVVPTGATTVCCAS